MNDGNHVWIEYLASDDTPRRATLTGTDVNLPAAGIPLFNHWSTDDSQWVVENPDGTTPTVEWMFFRATDGSERKVRIACGYSPVQTPNGYVDRIVSIFVYQYPDGSDEHCEGAIWLKDPQGTPYRLTLNDVYRPFPTSPIFNVAYHP